MFTYKLLLCIGMLLCHLTCIFMDNEALKATAESSSGSDSAPDDGKNPEKLLSLLKDFKEYMWDLIKTSIPPVAILAFVISTVFLGSICCLT
ncbi:small integral membrane protein 9 [Sorex araneus]|uniref:small integral membrane protein 9 n=1 Tax=Sorex araneus TaxID=42254 RepID=UPI00064B4097|nr:small integral membrane protein 9 [Sorex araneus]